MCTNLPTVWRRVQETPLELSIAFLAFAASVLTLVYEWAHLSWLGVLLFVVLGLGGLAAVAGRLADDPDVEAAGLALIIAALLFVTIRQIRHAVGVEQVAGVLLNTGALVIGFGIRLYVIRRAAKARRAAARITHGDRL